MENDKTQLDRIENLLTALIRDTEAHRIEIKWLKGVMGAFFATLMTTVYKVFSR